MHFGFKMESSEEIIEETDEKAPEVDLKVLEAIKAKELAEDRFQERIFLQRSTPFL